MVDVVRRLAEGNPPRTLATPTTKNPGGGPSQSPSDGASSSGSAASTSDATAAPSALTPGRPSVAAPAPRDPVGRDRSGDGPSVRRPRGRHRSPLRPAAAARGDAPHRPHPASLAGAAHADRGTARRPDGRSRRQRPAQVEHRAPGGHRGPRHRARCRHGERPARRLLVGRRRRGRTRTRRPAQLARAASAGAQRSGAAAPRGPAAARGAASDQPRPRPPPELLQRARGALVAPDHDGRGDRRTHRDHERDPAPGAGAGRPAARRRPLRRGQPGDRARRDPAVGAGGQHGPAARDLRRDRRQHVVHARPATRSPPSAGCARPRPG